MTHPKLAAIPDDLLVRTTGSAEQSRPARLMRWLDLAGYRPSCLDLEQERSRRTRPPAPAPVEPGADPTHPRTRNRTVRHTTEGTHS